MQAGRMAVAGVTDSENNVAISGSCGQAQERVGIHSCHNVFTVTTDFSNATFGFSINLFDCKIRKNASLLVAL